MSRPSQSQVEAARLLIKMLARESEPISDTLWRIAGADAREGERPVIGGRPRRGEGLSPDQVREIVRRSQEGESQRALAEAFGVSRATIHHHLRKGERNVRDETREDHTHV